MEGRPHPRETKKKSKKKEDKGEKKRDRGASSKRKRGEDEEAGPSSVVPDWKKTKDKAEQKKRKKERDANKQDDGVDGGGIAADRLSSYTASTKRTGKKKDPALKGK